jgi:DNA invertase Pin-like site-specific DNA recombinase
VGSASPWQRKARGDFDQLIADLRADTFAAHVLVLFVSDRGSRKVSEWSDLIDLLAQRAVQVFVTTHDRLYDPRVRRDWKTLMEDAVAAEDYARALSENVLRAARSAAADGEIWGQAPYGFLRRYDERTRRLIAQEADPDEAPVVAWWIDQIYSGTSLMALEKLTEQRGIRTRSGKRWTAQHIRNVVLNPVYSGLRVHDPERWQHGTRKAWPTESATTTEAVWPAIVNVTRQAVVRQRFAERRRDRNPGQVVPRPGRAKHLLSRQPGVLCGVCSSVLSVKLRPDGVTEMYRCNAHGHVVVDKIELDALVEPMVIGYLARPDNFEPAESDAGELAAVRAALVEARAEWDALADLSARLAAKKEPAVLATIARLEQRESDLSAPAELDGPLSPGEDIAVRWAPAPLLAKRDMVRLLLTGRYLGQLRIGQSGGNRWHTPPLRDRMSFSHNESAIAPDSILLEGKGK